MHSVSRIAGFPTAPAGGGGGGSSSGRRWSSSFVVWPEDAVECLPCLESHLSAPSYRAHQSSEILATRKEAGAHLPGP